MPTGKITDPEGPGAQGALGQVLGTDQKIYPFHNTIRFRKDEPVIFELWEYQLKINGDLLTAPIAVPDPRMNGNWSSNGFAQRWNNDWTAVQDEIAGFGLKRNGKELNNLHDVLDMANENDFKLENNPN
jgi:hypothetical protein